MNRQKVEVIPATKRQVRNGGQLNRQQGIRVAAYCRVSTGEESQQTSYAAQKTFYTDLITHRRGWTFAGIYADEAKSGTSRKHRAEFNRMMTDALEGRLDYIVTKSISRFARNTVDTLNCVRQLRQQNPPVGVYFEKENIDTLDAAGELILTILSALAQEESRSISDNIRWSIQKGFQAGRPRVNLERMLGYEKGEGGAWVIDPEQAQIVRFIFEHYVCGQSANRIAQELNGRGRTTVNGRSWSAGAVLTILRNEKYVGDVAMQKTVTKDFLTHRSTVNRGEAPRYYVENHHTAIIDRTTWDKVQAMLQANPCRNAKPRPAGQAGRACSASPFHNLVCGAVLEQGTDAGKVCGERLFRMTYTGVAVGYTDARSLAATGDAPAVCREQYVYAYPVWRCRRRRAQRKEQRETGHPAAGARCPSESLCECALEQSFMEMLYRLKREYARRGDGAELCVLFRQACERLAHQQKAPDARMQEPEGEQQETLAVMQRNFRFFLACLQELPVQNAAGMPLKINGLDTQPGAAEAPELLRFEKGIYCAFVQKGIVLGDIVAYETNFGVTLHTCGNRRTLASFVGFQKCSPEGIVTQIGAPYCVYEHSIQYRRKPGKNRDKTAVPRPENA